MSPSRLAELLERPPVAGGAVVLDVRHRLLGPPARADHEAGHIPGAVFLDVDTDLSDTSALAAGGPVGPDGRHPLPDPDALQVALRAAGVREDSVVVVHDVGDGTFAARAWWVLRWAGVAADRVAVLDGGFAAWESAGLPVTAEPTVPEPGDVVVRPGAMPVLDADAAAEIATTGVLVDARAGARFRGETEPLDPVAGHVPGAVNLPATDLTGPDRRWQPAGELAERLRDLGLGGDGAQGAYCGSGVTAAAVVFGAEYSGVRPAGDPLPLYTGSWSGWSSDPRRPVATGDVDGGAS